MYNPLYAKVLNIICKTGCGTTCDKCFQRCENCAKYFEYSNIAISLVKSKLVSMKNEDVFRLSYEKECLSRALKLVCSDFIYLRKSLGPVCQEADYEMADRYLRYAKRIVDYKRENEQ